MKINSPSAGLVAGMGVAIGIRWKWLIRTWDVYPDLLEAKCYPLNREGK